ncbi:DUF4212 domain-containing protein [Halolamina sp. CBA1230]|uniref:DUF4212 domain-containing protein n=1 Tax=Halolamina sp. CBA1230 TaxID=1853690 RepID=UPI0009A1CFE7|nr:DUF4212 domain-containing protein [Halolamina sp. CBA1230]QKY19915.1 DUF4212 domain-containing protein [Halolamina sp. CBA1230]
MTQNPSHEPDDSDDDLATDGGVAEQEEDVDYLDTEINILNPNTPFMRDHLKQVWAGFIAWTILTWGPVTATFLAPGLMTQEIPIIQFPAHYFTVAFVAPTSSLVLAFIYTRRRDRLDEKYGIDHSTPAGSEASPPEEGAAVSDGGEAE